MTCNSHLPELGPVCLFADMSRWAKILTGLLAARTDVRDHTPPDQALAQSCKRPFGLRPVKKDVAGLSHAASRSVADK